MKHLKQKPPGSGREEFHCFIFSAFCHMIKNINRYGISWYYFRARSPTQIQTWSFIQSQVSTCGRNVFITQRKKYWNLTSNICRMLSERSGFRCVLSGAFTPALGAVGRMLLPGLNRAGEAKSCRVSVLLAAFSCLNLTRPRSYRQQRARRKCSNKSFLDQSYRSIWTSVTNTQLVSSSSRKCPTERGSTGSERATAQKQTCNNRSCKELFLHLIWCQMN